MNEKGLSVKKYSDELTQYSNTRVEYFFGTELTDTQMYDPLLVYSHIFAIRLWMPNVHIPEWNFSHCRILAKFSTK
jgi:hypothetical protein